MSTIAPLRHWPRYVLHAIGASLLPPTCCMCGFPGSRRGLDLCEICAILLPPHIAHPWESSSTFVHVLVPFRYAYPVDHFIRSLKFRRKRSYARVLGMLLAQAQQDSGAALPQALIPVPLHSSRYRERGFNQSHEIARFAAATLGVPVDHRCLTRVIPTKEQSGLTVDARRRNVHGAFRAHRRMQLEHVALVDDVLTTGNTAEAAAYALRAAGVRRIELWALARVYSPWTQGRDHSHGQTV